MSDERPLIPMWYAGDHRTGAEPTRTFIREGDEWPERDTHGRQMWDGHHHAEWADARDALMSEAQAGLQLDTRELLRVEAMIGRAREQLAESAKRVYHLQRLKEPDT